MLFRVNIGPNKNKSVFFIEVRDSQTGYLVPVHDASAALEGGQSRRDVAAAVSCHLEIQVDVQARKLLLKVFLRFWGRGERYLRMETGVLLRISLRTS